mmetsp:Transcript_13592/g.21724  ORF Transcript_13592/g.21724 Transcript_13592/m.21724 type:complete len:81 (-) Transcript_13592:532-774(-)
MKTDSNTSFEDYFSACNPYNAPTLKRSEEMDFLSWLHCFWSHWRNCQRFEDASPIIIIVLTVWFVRQKKIRKNGVTRKKG